MSSTSSCENQNVLCQILSEYNDGIDSESSLEDGECTTDSENSDKEYKLRQKLLKKYNDRKRKLSDQSEIDIKYPKLEYNENFSCVRSRFDSESGSKSPDYSQNNEFQIINNGKSPVETKSQNLLDVNLITEISNPDISVWPEESKLSPVSQMDDDLSLNIYYPARNGCRSIENYEMLNRIEEGAYGEVFRARDKNNNNIYAVKKLKLQDGGSSRFGFPITSIREVNTLMQVSNHANVVKIREVVTKSNSLSNVYLVMEFVEHDLKSYLKLIQRQLQTDELKCLLKQLFQAVAHLHDNWIIHRDLKTSNLLLSHKGILKVADFGLAREYGSPLKPYTSLVVTLWYRAPELLLGQSLYSTSVDVWSIGCIMGELVLNKPMFQGKTELEQLQILFREFGGKPTEENWPGCSQLPGLKTLKNTKVSGMQSKKNSKKLSSRISPTGLSLLYKLLTMCPANRISAEDACKHNYFSETPYPLLPQQMPKYPAKSEIKTTQKSKKLK